MVSLGKNAAVLNQLKEWSKPVSHVEMIVVTDQEESTKIQKRGAAFCEKKYII